MTRQISKVRHQKLFVNRKHAPTHANFRGNRSNEYVHCRAAWIEAKDTPPRFSWGRRWACSAQGKKFCRFSIAHVTIP